MRISWNWLTELCPTDKTPSEVAARLTLAGLEVEGVTDLGRDCSGVVVAAVVERRSHPRSQKLSLVVVDDGAGRQEVVCGAANVPEPGGKVLWARPGARLPGGREIEVKEVAGVSSPGMLCSEIELGIGDDAGGIIVLRGGDATAARLGQTAQDALALVDSVLEVNVTANRPDCLGHVGVAREVAAIFGARLVLPPAALEGLEGGTPAASRVGVTVADPAGCPRYTARLIDGLAVAPAPAWMRRRLAAVGVRPISNLVDVTNYVLFELGQPLHAFDLDLLRGGRIDVRRARAGERMTTLDTVERELIATDLLICDGERPVALAGVMGGAGSEIGAATRGVLLESAAFEPRGVRRTSRRLGLASESSYRFERGVDLEGTDFASRRACRLLAELGGGRVAPGGVDVRAPAAPRLAIPLRGERLARVVGVAIDLGEASDHLRRLGCEVSSRPVADLGDLHRLVVHRSDRLVKLLELDAPEVVIGNEKQMLQEASAAVCDGGCEILDVVAPPWRPDLEREIDLIEEVARLHGFEHIPATLLETPIAPGSSGDALLERSRDGLAAAGLAEAITFGFTSAARIAALGGQPEPLTLRNPMREDQAVMRTSLLPNLLAAVAKNLAFGTADIALFEVGAVFLPASLGGGDAQRQPSVKQLPDEPRRAAFVLSGQRGGWLVPGEAVDFSDARGVVERLAAALRASVFFAPTSTVPWLHPGVAAEIAVDGRRAGVVGEIHPETLRRFGIERRVFGGEIDLEALPALAPSLMAAIPRFPPVARDVSFFVDERTPAARVAEVCAADRPPLLESFRVVEDYREAGKVPAGKKGMLWSMVYRATGRTLTDAEVDSVHESLVARLLAALPAERR